MQDVEGYKQIIQEMLASMSPEQRLAGLDPEQRLAGLPPDQQLLALSDELLRGFSEEYLCSLPSHVEAAIRARIGRSRGH